MLVYGFGVNTPPFFRRHRPPAGWWSDNFGHRQPLRSQSTNKKRRDFCRPCVVGWRTPLFSSWRTRIHEI